MTPADERWDKPCANCGFPGKNHSADGLNRCPGTYGAGHPLVAAGVVKAGDMWPMQYEAPHAKGTVYA